MWYMIRNLRCTVTINSVLANSKTQNAFLFTVNAIFRHDYPLAVEPASTPRPLIINKKRERERERERDSLSIDMLLSAGSFLVVAQSSSEIPEGLMNNPVYETLCFRTDVLNTGHGNVKNSTLSPWSISELFTFRTTAVTSDSDVFTR